MSTTAIIITALIIVAASVLGTFLGIKLAQAVDVLTKK